MTFIRDYYERKEMIEADMVSVYVCNGWDEEKGEPTFISAVWADYSFGDSPVPDMCDAEFEKEYVFAPSYRFMGLRVDYIFIDEFIDMNGNIQHRIGLMCE